MRRTSFDNDDDDRLRSGGRKSSVVRYGTRKDRKRYDSYLKRKGSYYREKSCLQKQIRTIGPRQPKNLTKGIAKVRVINFQKEPLAIQVLNRPDFYWTVLFDDVLIDLDLPLGSELFIMKVVKNKKYKIISNFIVLGKNDLL